MKGKKPSLTNTERFHFGAVMHLEGNGFTLGNGALIAFPMCFKSCLWLILQTDVWVRMQEPAGRSRNLQLQHGCKECTIDLSAIYGCSHYRHYCVLLSITVTYLQFWPNRSVAYKQPSIMQRLHDGPSTEASIFFQNSKISLCKIDATGENLISWEKQQLLSPTKKGESASKTSSLAGSHNWQLLLQAVKRR